MLAAGYLVLLVVSHVVRSTQSDFSPREEQRSIQVPAFDHQAATSQQVRISFMDSGGTGPVVVLLHGSPAASSFIQPLHESLAKSGRYRILTPDLPGFEGSSRRLADYSFSSHASYVSAWLDSLGVSKAHVIGYSMSGGVLAELMHFDPERLSSVVLLSSIGVQELELIGDYYLNHLVHSLQLGVIWSVSELIPHFGAFDKAFLGLPYARNFYDSDQRPLRGYLAQYNGPALILHGEKDGLLPYSAALEHHRIIPQSELVSFPEWGHGIPFQHPNEAAEVILGWVDRAENAHVQFKSDASNERVTNAGLPFDAHNLPPLEGVGLVVLLILIATTTFLSEDLAAIGAGLLVARGSLDFDAALMATFAGIFTGDIGLYVAGRVLGARIVSLPPFSWFIRKEQLERGKAWFKKEGAKVVLISRVIPGSRFPTYVAAGVVKAPFWKFAGLFFIGTVVWTPIIVGVSTIMGNQILSAWAVYESYALWVFWGLVLFVYGIFHVGIPLASHLGRRKLAAKWQRTVHWEFWPAFLFYIPILGYIAYLAVKHRSLTAFTAVNPGIPDGGFVGESKSKILDLLASSPNWVAKHRLITSLDAGGAGGAGAAAAAAADLTLQFMKEEGLHFPLVMKPDVGERGHGVFILESEAEVGSFFESDRGPTIAQEYISGEEFGIFYVRHPSEQTGFITSITHKKLIGVVGNGKHSLERLILDDPRARCMYKTFARRHASQLDTVVESGVRFQLVDVGTHTRGALFLNGEHLITEALERAFNQMAVSISGFYFGRFDVRVPHTEDLLNGKNIKILELNGVTSEATHIYDPSTRLRDAYRSLAQGWKLAFEIGMENIRSGTPPSSLARLVDLIIQFKIRPRTKPETSSSARL